MTKYHINKHGVPAPCKARAGNCPFGGDDSHFDSQEAAQVSADKANESEHSLLPKIETEVAAPDYSFEGIIGRDKAADILIESMSESRLNTAMYNTIDHLGFQFSIITNQDGKGEFKELSDKIGKDNAFDEVMDNIDKEDVKIFKESAADLLLENISESKLNSAMYKTIDHLGFQFSIGTNQDGKDEFKELSDKIGKDNAFDELIDNMSSEDIEEVFS